MASVQIISENEAPAAPKAMTRAAQESLAILNQLSKGKVARIEPGEGQSIRGLKSSISRVATNNKLKVTQWDVDGVLYVKLV
ncbi:MAG: hypothetical protein KC438_04405 [Thermomicrobiales bacterium]|nr:hypothetical protein [Thermomicrobiales bacterium]MCO5223160.1 hypothetical protein [Thermomicrobiales bacterium]